MRQNRTNGIPVILFALPLLIITVVLHVTIAVLIANINNESNQLADLIQRSGTYQMDATSMQASNTLMNETCGAYIKSPIGDDHTPNFGSLMTYATELSSDRRSPEVLNRFREYDVDDEVFLCIETASYYSELIMQIQIHAISVMASVYPLPNIPELSAIPIIELTQDELDMTNENRVEYAQQLLLDNEYAHLRFYVSENIDKCNQLLRDEFEIESTRTAQYVTLLRNVLWLMLTVVVISLTTAFIYFCILMVKPLRKYSKDIRENRSLTQTGRILEMQQLVTAFNGLWNNRNKLELILREAAENDALTGLPNRYCMEHDLIDSNFNENSLAILLFDVDFLKQTNDNLGHMAGDKLICTAAACIKECFGLENAHNCYRIGGDEFVSFIPRCTEKDIKNRLEKFSNTIKKENISVSVGYGFSNKIENNNFMYLMSEADKKMYEQKKHNHSKNTLYKNGVDN